MTDEVYGEDTFFSKMNNRRMVMNMMLTIKTRKVIIALKRLC